MDHNNQFGHCVNGWGNSRAGKGRGRGRVWYLHGKYEALTLAGLPQGHHTSHL